MDMCSLRIVSQIFNLFFLFPSPLSAFLPRRADCGNVASSRGPGVASAELLSWKNH